MSDKTLTYHKSLLNFKSHFSEGELLEITEGKFFDLIEELPAALVNKLQLNFRDYGRMNHLLYLIEFMSNYDIADVVSIEGSNPEVKHDMDLAVWIEVEGDQVLDIIDFTGTSATELIDAKHMILMETATSISESFGVNVRAHVKHFKTEQIKTKYKFVKTFKMDQGGFSKDFNILSYFHESGTKGYTEFIKNCQEVSSMVDDYILGFKHKEVAELHKSWDPPESLVENCLIMAQKFDPNKLNDLFPNIGRRHKDIAQTIGTLCRKYAQNKKKTKLLVGPPNPRKLDQKLINILESLSDDPVACVLFEALKLKQLNIKTLWVVIDKDGVLHKLHNPEIVLGVLTNPDFLVAAKSSEDAETDSWFDMAWGESLVGCEKYVSYLKGEDPADSNQVLSNPFGIDQAIDVELTLKTINEAVHEKEERINYLSLPVESTNCINNKFLKVSSLCSEQNLEHQVLPLSNSQLIAEIMANTVVGTIMSHYHEIAKSFSYGLKAPSRKCRYHVGICGPYKSVVLSRNSGTQDSFKSSHFLVIYSSSIMNLKEITLASVRNGVLRTQMSLMNKNSLDYWIRLPMVVLSASSWMREMYSSDTSVSVLRLICELFDMAIINRDPFSQAAEQVRYFVMGSMGYGCDFTKICDKMHHLIPKSPTELIYPIRTLILGFSIDVIRRSNKMHLLRGENGDISLSMPHTIYKTTCFSQIVSSFYIHKMSNKFRAFKEISEAHCLVGLNEEREIYAKRCKEEGGYISGFSLNTRQKYKDETYLNNNFIQSEVSFAIHMINSGVKRFTGSIPYVIGVTSKRHKMPESLWKEIFSAVGSSPIEAATMRGSMKAEELSKSSQSLRAASSILEGIVSRHGFISDEVNNPRGSLENAVALLEISKKPKNLTIYTLSAMIYMTGYLLLYAYRVVDKDQIGFREISVLNFLMRMGCLYIETICRTISKNMSNVDVVNEANKLKILQEMVRKEVRIKDFPTGVEQVQVFDNSDQKRWGPNHNMNMFAAFLLPILHDRPGIYDLALNVLYMMTRKVAKYPENLITLRDKRKGKTGNSEVLTRAFKIMNTIDFGEVGMLMEFGMGQGILHSNSSIVGATKSEHVDELLMIDPLVNAMSLVTSDDAERRIDCPSQCVQSVCFKNHNYETSVGILFNIIRGNNKSGTGPRPELNSNWFNKGEYMNPSIKEAIAKIDTGQGGCFSKDLLAALDGGASAFSTGCSYTTSLTITLCSLTLVLESWNAWSFKNCWHKDVELLGLPFIEPIITYFTGSLSNVYLKSFNLTRLDHKVFSKYVLHTMIEKYDATSLTDYVRPGQNFETDINSLRLTIPEFYESFYLGISSRARTPKQLSQFNKRHKLKDWNCPDSFFTLNEWSTRSDCLIGNIITRMRHTPALAFSQHPFFIRFTDPSCNFNRKCLRVSEVSALRTILELDTEERFSRKELIDKISSGLTDPIRYSNILYEKEAHTPDNILSDRLSERFIMAKSLLQRFKKFPSGSHERIDSRRGLGYISKMSHIENEISSKDFYSQVIINSDLEASLKIDLLNELDCGFATANSRILMQGTKMTKIEVIDMMKGMWQSINKNVKTKITCITRHPASNLTECIDDILQFNLVAPGKGTKEFSLGDLTTGTSHWVSYKRNMSIMEERAHEMMTYYIKNNFNASDRTFVKPKPLYIDNENRLVTTSDNDIVLKEYGQTKSVKFTGKDTASMIKQAKRWLSVDAVFSMTGPFAQKICADQMLLKGSYRLSPGCYIRSMGHSKLEVTTNDGKLFHSILIKETENLLSAIPTLSYKHVFLTARHTSSLQIHAVKVKENKSFYNDLKAAMEGKSVNLGIEYQVGDDLVEFKSIMDKDFSLTMFQNCNYICFANPELIIPITPADTRSTSDELGMGYKITLEDSSNAFMNLRLLQDMIESNNTSQKAFAKSVIEKVLKTNYGQHYTLDFEFTKPWGMVFNSVESIDLLRGFLLSSKNRSVSDNLLNVYVNNMFSTDSRKGIYNSELITQADKLSISLSSPLSASTSYFSNLSDSEYMSEISEFSEPSMVSAALPRRNILPDHLQTRKILAYVKRSIKSSISDKNFNLFLRSYSLIEVPAVIVHSRNLHPDIIRQFSNIDLPVPFSVAVALLRHTIGDLADFELPSFDFDI